MGKNFYDEITLNEEQKGENFFDEVTPRSKSSCKASILSRYECNSEEGNSEGCLQSMEVVVPVYKETNGYNIPILI